jgi:hypothetical protein
MAARWFLMMAEVEDPRRQAAAARAMEARARRLARELNAGADRDRLLRYAGELEERAARLEAHGFGKPGVVEKVRQHQQSQGPSSGTTMPPDRKPSG